MIVELNTIQTMALAVMILGIGQVIKKKVSFFESFCIPAPVIGGVLFAVMTLILKSLGILEFNFETTLQSVFMTAFFTTVGFTASLKPLIKGGKKVFIFLVAAIMLVVLQNVLGVSVATIFGINPLIGLSTGSVPMTGGHGTSGAFAPLFEAHGATGSTAVAMASATFGLIVGSLIGGPIGQRLIKKHDLRADKAHAQDNQSNAQNEVPLSAHEFMTGSMQVILAMGLGTIISASLEKSGITFPPYIGAMFAAAIFRNFADFTNIFAIKEDEISVISNTSLSIFLAMALMSLKLWQLADLATPMIIMLISQTILMGLFAYYITFNVMGRDYDAAVMACGHCGFGMGATPNAMANMGAMAERHGFSPTAFFILPLIGSLFIDFFNAGIITFFMNRFI